MTIHLNPNIIKDRYTIKIDWNKSLSYNSYTLMLIKNSFMFFCIFAKFKPCTLGYKKYKLAASYKWLRIITLKHHSYVFNAVFMKFNISFTTYMLGNKVSVFNATNIQETLYDIQDSYVA